MSRKKIPTDNDGESGIRAKAIAEGRWVKTMVGTRPMRFASEAAKSAERAERMAPIEKRVPRAEGERENLVWKKYVTHDLSTC